MYIYLIPMYIYIYIYIEVLTDASSFTNHCPKERYEGEELKFVRTPLLILIKNILGSIHVVILSLDQFSLHSRRYDLSDLVSK